MSNKYWTDDNHLKLDLAKTYSELFLIARDVLSRMPRPIAQVCGPISTGGAGSVEENLKRFDKYINKLVEQGIEVFDQMPFEIPMQRILETREFNDYDKSILTDFYLPIFEGRLIDKTYFLPDWESSTGATWEHEQSKKFGIEIIYLED